MFVATGQKFLRTLFRRIKIRVNKPREIIDGKTYELILILIALLLIIIWFHKGMMLGTGESGLPFYNAVFFFPYTNYLWSGLSLGYPVTTSILSIPFYFIISSLEFIGIPGVILQAFTFLLILVIGFLAIYHTSLLASPDQKMSAFIASLFYMLNPYSIVVWNRFQYTYMAFYVLMPLTLFLFIKGIKKHKLIYVFYINVVCLFFVLAFAEPPFIGTFWLVLLSYFIFHVLNNLRNKPEIGYTIKFFGATFFLWLLFNAWWIIPFIFQYQTAQTGTITSNEGILEGVSAGLGSLINLLRLFYPVFFTNMESVWGPIYFSAGFDIISFFIPLTAFSAILFKRNKLIVYFAALSILGLFLAKGVLPPFGGVFLWMFTHIPGFFVFRNSFEKLGIIIPIGYAVLFGAGLSSIYRWMRKHLRIGVVFNEREYGGIERFVAAGIIVLICFSTIGIYVWPMWTGMVFTSGIPPSNNPNVGYYVDVPSYYVEANEWLSNQTGNFRLLVLPVQGVGTTYNWTYGYSGTIISQLFNKPSIYLDGVPTDDNLVVNLNSLLLSTTQFWKVMDLLNAKYIIVQSDVDYTTRGLMSPSEIEKALNNSVLVPNVVNGMVDTNSSQVRGLIGKYNPQNWTPIWASQGTQISINSNDTTQSPYSVVLTGETVPQPAGDYVLSLRYLLPADEQDWSNVSYLLIWLKSSVPGAVWVTIADKQGRSLNWFGPWGPTGWVGNPNYTITPQEVDSWKLFVFPIYAPNYIYNGGPDLHKIVSIGFVIRTMSNTTASLKVGGVFIDYGKMEKMMYIHYARSFGKLAFYALDDDHFLPRIYAVNNFTFTQDIYSLLFGLIPNNSFDPRNTAVFLQSQSNMNDVALLDSLRHQQFSKPVISFKEINPTEYIVKVENATTPFFLIFSETYNPQWKAYYGNVNWFYSLISQSIPEQDHFIVNGYANAWYINKTGSYTITLYYKPQSLVVLGAYISLVAFIAVIILVFFYIKISKSKTIMS